MRSVAKIAMLAVAGTLMFSSASFSQGATETLTINGQALVVPAGLGAALAAGDTATISILLADAKTNATLTANIATACLATAQADKATNPALAGVLALIASNTGALTPQQAAMAMNIGNNPTAQTNTTNANGPNTGSSGGTGNSGSSSPGPSTPASNSGQTSPSNSSTPGNNQNQTSGS